MEKIGKIASIYKKKGAKDDPGNYRGITLLNTLGKVFTHIVFRGDLGDDFQHLGQGAEGANIFLERTNKSRFGVRMTAQGKERAAAVIVARGIVAVQRYGFIERAEGILPALIRCGFECAFEERDEASLIFNGHTPSGLTLEGRTVLEI